MKKGYTYTIIFMMIVAAIFTSLLATADAVAKPQIDKNKMLYQRKAIMYAFNIPTDVSDEKVAEVFEKNILPDERNGIEAFKYVDDSGNVKGYAFPFQGSALWGRVKGYMALDPDLKDVLGITFTEQNETPGLGGRIDEAPFKEQWRGVVLPEGDLRYGKIGDKEIDAISGATLTSNSVIGILNNLKNNVIPQWR